MKSKVLLFASFFATLVNLVSAQGNYNVQGNYAISGNLGIGVDTPAYKLQILSAVNNNWAAKIQNIGGFGQGLHIRSGNKSNELPAFRVESYDNTSPLNVGLQVETNGKLKVGLDPNGTLLYDSKLSVYQSSNNDWAGTFYNAGGFGKGLRIRSGSNSSEITALKVEGFNNTSPLKVGLQVESNGKVKVGLDPNGTFVYDSKLNVYQSSNTDWAGIFVNAGGQGKGLKVRSGASSEDPALQIEDNYGNVRMLVKSNGNVGIGTSQPSDKLTVNGTIHSTRVLVDLNVPGPDYVFDESYNLKPLQEVEDFVSVHKHLPEVSPAVVMEANGIEVGEFNMMLLRKIEELTLYLIEQKKMIECLKLQLEELKN